MTCRSFWVRKAARLAWSAALTAGLAALIPGAASAQTMNPRSAEFTPSADHNDSTIVQSYQIEFYNPGATTPFSTASLGKPAPQADGFIRVDLSTIFLGWPVPGTVYTSTVSAVGPGGAGRSAPSNTFAFSAPCSYSVSPASLSPGSSSGTGSLTVTTAAGCGWTATESASWVTVTSGASGTGSGSVGLSFSANTSTSSRTATVTVAGQPVDVTQAGAACSYTASPTSLSPTSDGGVGSVSVSTIAGCSWTATENASWITIASGASGTGSGTVGLTFAANTSTSSRTATVTVAGQPVNVTQAAATSCTYTPSTTSLTTPAPGGTGSVGVAAPSGCTWAAAETASWITISSGASGNGNGTVGLTFAANTLTSSRTATVTVAGHPVSVTQAAVACSYTISPTSATPSNAGGAQSAAVTTSTGCAWTATSDVSWITISSGATGNGSGVVGYTVANNSGQARTGTLTIAGKTLTVTQGPAAPAPPSNFRVTE